MSNIFQKKIAVYNIMSELMDKLDYLDKDADYDINYNTEQLAELSDDDNSWRRETYTANISNAKERKDAIATARKYIENFIK